MRTILIAALLCAGPAAAADDGWPERTDVLMSLWYAYSASCKGQGGPNGGGMIWCQETKQIEIALNTRGKCKSESYSMGTRWEDCIAGDIRGALDK